MSGFPSPGAESPLTKRQILLGLIAVFAVYSTINFFAQTIVIARPRMTADLNGMPWYSWGISIPSLGAAFVSLVFSKFSDMYGRRRMLMISTIIFGVGTILSALSPTFPILVAATTLYRIGSGALMPLVYAVLGDMFAPAERGRWVGLLNIPQGIFALVGPTLGGWFVDNMSWRHLFWMGLPLIGLCLLLIPVGVPAIAVNETKKKIDVRGVLLVAVASCSTILGFSFAGTVYPWGSIEVAGLLGTGLVFWVLFFCAEGHADEPILDPQVFRNRTFLTVAVAGLLSFFGLMGVMMYFPVFLQGVQGVTVLKSGQIMTPYSVVVAFVGVPTGFILARTRRYKWLYIASYGCLTAILAVIAFFDRTTSLNMSLIITTLAGLALGTIPTMNTLVVQYAVPKKLLGTALGAIFFSITMGMAIAPAVLGSVMNVTYSANLQKSIPAELSQVADEKTIIDLGDPKALLSPAAMKKLKAEFAEAGSRGSRLFPQTVDAIRSSMEAGVRSVFLLGALAMLLSFLLVITLPELPVEAAVQAPKPAVEEAPV